jgi:hypothetical protein
MTVRADLRFGDVLRRSFSLFGHSALPFIGITALLTAPDLFLSGSLGWNGSSSPAADPPVSRSWVEAITPWFSNLLLEPLAQSAVLFMAFETMEGRRGALRPAVGRAFARLLPIVGTAICYYLFVIAGAVLLVVPGIVIAVRASVAIPACMIEDLGPVAAIRRSDALTRGHRWQVFGLYLIPFVVTAIAAAVIGALSATSALANLIEFVLNVLATSYGAVLGIVIYHDLRVAGEGVGTDRIAAVFD